MPGRRPPPIRAWGCGTRCTSTSKIRRRLNGIDYVVRNPEIDILIPSNYTAGTIEQKYANKDAQTLAPPDRLTPQIVCTTRYVPSADRHAPPETRPPPSTTDIDEGFSERECYFGENVRASCSPSPA